MTLKSILSSTLAAIIFAAVSGRAEIGPAPSKSAGPWDLAELRHSPEATWGQADGLLQEVYYAGEPFHGKSTRVFAYCGRPEGKGPFPAILLVHGGGGAAFKDWARHWAKRGYVSLAMDLAGNGPAGRLTDGGPDQDDNTKFREFTDSEVKDMWTYHAVAAVIRGHSLLASMKEVDPTRIGMTGISWGGYLTCIVAGLDDRLKVAVPVYGCGFLHENSIWLDRNFKPMSEVRLRRWVENFEPSQYLGNVKCPMLFRNGTCDFAYPLDSYQKSYSLVKAPVSLSITINLGHGHNWGLKEVDAFIDSYLTGGISLPKVSPMKIVDGKVSATLSLPPDVTATKTELDYTTDVGAWHARKWNTLPAELKGDTLTATLPKERPLTFYLRVTDGRSLSICAPHVELAKESTP
ncbi:MAG: acetylxylan esterase [Verrucomicrobiaceae bacterium]